MKLNYDENNLYNLNMEENIIFEFLKDLYLKEKTKYSFDDYWCNLSNETFRTLFGMSNFKQRELFRNLEKKGLVIFKFGQSKARYFQIVSLKKQAVIDNLIKKLKVIGEKDIDRILTSINEVLDDRN